MPVPPETAPDLVLGLPVATWALVVSLFSFSASVLALGWQIAKHFLDGGRVRVYLNTAAWEPEFSLTTNTTGHFTLSGDQTIRSLRYGRALEVAQLVVENPGRVPLTVYSPGLSFSGHGKRNHTISPRMFETDRFGSDQPVADQLVRLEPYARVTFLLDYWSVLPQVVAEAKHEHVFVRGYVSVAGRTKRPQKSAWRLRWRIDKHTYTAVPGQPTLTPFAVLWREVFVQTPAFHAREVEKTGATETTRGMVGYLLERAMGRFTERPTREELADALDEEAQKRGDRYPALGSSIFAGYQALDRMEGHLTRWTEGIPAHFLKPRSDAEGPDNRRG